jgi:ribosome-binding factor A
MKRVVAGGRSSRVVEQIHQEVADLVRTEVKDPRLGLVTITGVEITADYAHASIFFTVLPSDDESIARSTKGLQSASSFLRLQLGKRIRIHTTPALHFKYDGSTERGMAMSQLIDRVMENTPPAVSAEEQTPIPETPRN